MEQAGAAAAASPAPPPYIAETAALAGELGTIANWLVTTEGRMEIAMGVDGVGWEVGLWLETLSLHEHASVFQRERFDTLNDVNEITEEDLEAMDVPRGHRRRILTALPATLPDEDVPEGGEGGGGGGSGAIRKGKGKGTRESVGGEYDEDDELDFGHDDELDLSVSNISLGGAAHGAVATSPSGGDLDFGHDDELDLTEVTWLKSNGGKVYVRDDSGTYVHVGSGNTYAGEHKGGKMHGTGTFQSANGEEYIGDFYEGYEHGHGVHSWPDGTEYNGSWRNGKEDGDGTLIFAGGDTYVGTFKRGKRHGQGVITSLEGHKYTGGWKDDRRHGRGSMSYPDGRVESGEWEKGTLATPDAPLFDDDDDDDGDVDGAARDGAELQVSGALWATYAHRDGADAQSADADARRCY